MSSNNYKVTFIRDAIHKNINISEPVIQALISCKEFQRLRWINQLGGVQIAFPNATHTRYVHSIGVYNILNRVLSEVEGSSLLTKEEKTNIKIAGLLHDLGHGPFSHTFEKIINLNVNKKENFTHEDYTCAIINDNSTEINMILKQFNININAIIGILKKDYKNYPKYQIQLVSSQLDCDRIDYLMRDGYFTGVGYGSIDIDWIITNMIIDIKEGLVFSYKAISAIENYLITRFHMYSQVYYHKSGILFDLNLQKLFSRITELYFDKTYSFKVNIHDFIAIFEGKSVEIQTYLNWTDATLIKLMQDIINFEKDNELVKISKVILFCFNWENELLLLTSQNNTNVIGVKQDLKNVLYYFKKDPIIIKTKNEEYITLEKISQILQDPIKAPNTIYFLKKK
ncbi:HD domain-containing protein [Spiroplasma endosymbiont of Lariophagus distinguendus]|uniref:HD domain-containing protein n=2 Tax=unclassified Spiroplasma TaxID=2637901 RepID=UPI002079FDA8|nr:HD domain-containing protein [Spiroplasma endosymbiont of Lariophagus distinguendus]